MSTAWAWEDRLAVCGRQSLSQEDTEVLYLGRMWGWLRRGKGVSPRRCGSRLGKRDDAGWG